MQLVLVMIYRKNYLLRVQLQSFTHSTNTWFHCIDNKTAFRHNILKYLFIMYDESYVWRIRFLQNKYQYFFQIVSHRLYHHTSSTDIIIFQIYGDINLEDLFQNLRYIQPYIFPVSFCLAFNDLKIKFVFLTLWSQAAKV